MIDMSINLAGVTLKNPVITASGTCGYGKEYSPYYMPNELGAIAVKTLTAEPRLGNPPPRIAETPSGVLNAIGLQNPGVEYFIKNELPRLKKLKAVIIANIAGKTVEDYCKAAEMINAADVDMIELNISCPNVGKKLIGAVPEETEEVTKAVKKIVTKPLIVKLTPNVTDITEIARAAESGGADCLSLINTIMGMRIDINKRRPILGNITGGLSGPAIFPVAVRMVYQVKQVINLPIIGMGGISNGDDAVEMMLAGADAVAVGTAAFSNPYAPLDVRDGLEKYCVKNKIAKVSELTGGLNV